MSPQTPPATPEKTPAVPVPDEYDAENGVEYTKETIKHIHQHVNTTMTLARAKQQIPTKASNKFSVNAGRSHDEILKFNREVESLIELVQDSCKSAQAFLDLFLHTRASYQTIESKKKDLRKQITGLRKKKIGADMAMPAGESQVPDFEAKKATKAGDDAGLKQLTKLQAILVRVEMMPIHDVEEMIVRLQHKAPFTTLRHVLRVLEEAVVEGDKEDTAIQSETQ